MENNILLLDKSVPSPVVLNYLKYLFFLDFVF